MKKKILALALAVVLIAVAGYSTLAYFTAEDDATNKITADTLQIQINEYLTEGGAVQPVNGNGITISAENVVPGDTVAKIPKVKNLEASTAAWIRVKVTFTTDPTGLDTTLLSLVGGSGWTTKQPDGYYYYTSSVSGGGETTALFTGVLFATSIGNTWQDADITVLLEAQAVQSAHNGATWDLATGWPAP